ncbi:hypothetical protein ACEUA0_19535 [Aeromonas veronii]
MMSKVTLQQLKEVYKALSFSSDGASGSLFIESDALKSSIKNLLLSEENVNESGLNTKSPIDIDEIKIGDGGFNSEVQRPLKNQAALNNSSKTI